MKLNESILKNLKESKTSKYKQMLNEASVEKTLDKVRNYVMSQYNELGSYQREVIIDALNNQDKEQGVRSLKKFLNNPYNEIGGDDYYFLSSIIDNCKLPPTKEELAAKQARHKEIEKRKAEQQKKKDDLAAKGITSYSLRGKRQDVINSFIKALKSEHDITVCPPGPYRPAIEFNKDGVKVGLKAVLQNRNLPDDEFGMRFDIVAKKYADKLDKLINLSCGSYNDAGHKFYKFKIEDIPKMTNEIKNILDRGETYELI